MTMRAFTPPPDTQPSPPTDAIDRARLEGELEGLLIARQVAQATLVNGSARYGGTDLFRMLDKAIATKRCRLAQNPRGANG